MHQESRRKWIGVSIAIAAIAAAVTLLTACDHVKTRANDVVVADARLVHDAVQFAIDEAQKTGIWDRTSKEQVHWSAACEGLGRVEVSACAAASSAAESMCDEMCRDGRCSPFSQAVCKSASEGSSTQAFCSAAGVSGRRLTWCDAAKACNDAHKKTASACAALKTILLPRPKSATLTLAVQEKRGGTGSLNILVVTFGGGLTADNTHTITTVLEPRNRSSDYGIGPLPAMPAASGVSNEAKEMAGNLAQLIADAVRAATSDYAPDPVNPAASGAIGARPPLALSQLKIDFELTYDKSGKLGLKKEWTGPLGVTAEASAETKRTNKLEIVYSKAD